MAPTANRSVHAQRILTTALSQSPLGHSLWRIPVPRVFWSLVKMSRIRTVDESWGTSYTFNFIAVHICDAWSKISNYIELFRQRLPHKSVKTHATMPIRIMGSDSSCSLIEVNSFRNENHKYTCLFCFFLS